jgi:hypothetical protein
MPPRSKADRLLIAFVWGAAAFGVGANLTSWHLHSISVVLPTLQVEMVGCFVTGPAWELAPQLLGDALKGDFRLLWDNTAQARTLLLFACVAGLISYRWQERERGRGETKRGDLKR